MTKIPIRRQLEDDADQIMSIQSKRATKKESNGIIFETPNVYIQDSAAFNYKKIEMMAVSSNSSSAILKGSMHALEI